MHALGRGLARHYPRDMAPFSAIAEPTAAAYRDLAALAGPPREIGTFSDLPVYAIGKGLEPRGRLQLSTVALYKRAANHSNVASRMPSISNSFTVAST